jgi:hypothetical protein
LKRQKKQPLESAVAVERPTSPAKLANALNYSRSLGLVLDKDYSDKKI